MFCFFSFDRKPFSSYFFFFLIISFLFRAEDLVLAEDRTTEADKELIMEGELTDKGRITAKKEIKKFFSLTIFIFLAQIFIV